jgi:hypothetical protein
VSSHDLAAIGPACKSAAWRMLQKDRPGTRICFRFAVGGHAYHREQSLAEGSANLA